MNAPALEFYRTIIAKQEARLLVVHSYFMLRARHPTAPALLVWRYINDEATDESFEEFVCGLTGHEFQCSGTAYGGDDERWHGEGRCLCINCGKDGDA